MRLEQTGLWPAAQLRPVRCRSMDIEQVKTHLEEYENELESIIGRFKKNHHGIHIDLEDNYRMRQIAIELYDLISDHIPNSSRYARMALDYYNDGITNYLGSCSLSLTTK